MYKDVRGKIFSVCEKFGVVLVDDVAILLDELARICAVSDGVAATIERNLEHRG